MATVISETENCLQETALPRASVAPPSPRLGRLEVLALFLLSFPVLLSSYRGWWPISVAEAWGFATGGICVWLVVRQHMANWPIGLANNVFFFVLFYQGRLFADMGLQVVYFALGVYGWWNWRCGGAHRNSLSITRTTCTEWICLSAALPLATWGMQRILIAAGGAAPFWDALTTVLSLAAQYLLCRKRFENWWFWITADLIYVPLYFSRNLPLTGVLYGVFLILCLLGLREWRRKMERCS